MIQGCYDMDASEYHADPCPEPSLSRSIIHALVPPGSPLHAAYKHPLLCGDQPQRIAGDRTMQIGSVCHVMMFGRSDKIEVINELDYKKKAAKEARDVAADNGLLPILAPDYDRAKHIVQAGLRQLAEIEIDVFVNGLSERTLIWQEDNGVWCRARLDWCPLSPGEPIDDYKTTAGSAHPEIWQRAMFGCGDDIQASFYTRGWRKVFGDEPGPFRFVVQEQEPPYGISVTQLTGRAFANAEKKIDHAIRVWRQCLDSGKWPGYAQGYQIDIPSYREFFEEAE